MKKTIKRSGFTIVELVIVIAVIAVLAGVLIPTFGGIIERANESNDNQVVATVNKLLVVDNIIKGDDPNDAVEIKKMLKDNGVSLKTKSEGKYIWYDIDQNKVILAGLDANGIVFLNDNDKDPKASATKGTFKEATAPELFIDGYVFLSDESDDGLAEAIYDLRNPVDASSITKALGEISEMNPTLGEKLSSLMDRTVVLTKDNGAVFVGSNKDVVTKVIVSSEKTTLIKDDITSMSEYKNIIVVDLHSGVVVMDNDTLNAIKTNTIFYVYDSDEVKTKYDTNPDIQLLIPKSDRPEHIGRLDIVYVDQAGTIIDTEEGKDEFVKGGNFTINYQFPYQYFGTATEAYEFVSYSLFKNGANPIPLGTNGYTLRDEEQYLITDDATGILNLYVICKSADEDFVLDGKMYSSEIVSRMLSEGYNKTTYGSSIIVNSIYATLGYGSYTNLTIPEGVTLLIPRDENNTLNALADGLHKPTYDISTNPLYYDKGTSVGLGSKLNKDTYVGERLLTVASGTTLTNYGYITVDAKLYNYTNYQHGFILDDIGVLVVNGTIINGDTNNNTGNTIKGVIEAYGIIRGTGYIDSVTGSKIVELMAVLDLNGGSSTAAAITPLDNYFTGGGGKYYSPFNQFIVDNVRLPMTFLKGAVYTTYGGIYANDKVNTMEFKIADGSSTSNADSNNPLFELKSSDAKLIKSYKAGEGMKITLNGTVSDCKKKVTVMGYSVDFTNIPLPLPNFDVTIASGANVTLSSATYKVLPGSDIVVEEGGILNINCRVIVYDSFVTNEVSGMPDVRKYAGKFESNTTSFTVKGTLNLQSKADFSGTILGSDSNTTDNVKPTISVHKDTITSGQVWVDGGWFGQDHWEDNPINEGYGSLTKWTQLTVQGFDWKGKFVKSDSSVPTQIDMGADKTFTYNGTYWS